MVHVITETERQRRVETRTARREKSGWGAGVEASHLVRAEILHDAGENGFAAHRDR